MLKDSIKILNCLSASVTLCDDQETLSAVYQHITSAVNITNALASSQPCSVQCKIQLPQNKLLNTQQPFHSTKKHCQRALVRIAKPTTVQKQPISTELLQHVPLFRSNTHRITSPGEWTELNHSRLKYQSYTRRMWESGGRAWASWQSEHDWRNLVILIMWAPSTVGWAFFSSFLVYETLWKLEMKIGPRQSGSQPTGASALVY